MIIPHNKEKLAEVLIGYLLHSKIKVYIPCSMNFVATLESSDRDPRDNYRSEGITPDTPPCPFFSGKKGGYLE